MLLLIPLAFFCWEHRQKPLSRIERVVLICAWGVPLYGPFIAHSTHILIGPAVLLAFLWVALRRYLRPSPQPIGDAQSARL
jgi:hypothetical protein